MPSIISCLIRKDCALLAFQSLRAVDFTLTIKRRLRITGISITLCLRLYFDRQEKMVPYWHFNPSVPSIVFCSSRKDCALLAFQSLCAINCILFIKKRLCLTGISIPLCRQLYFVHQEKTVPYWHFNPSVPSIVLCASRKDCALLAFQSNRAVNHTLIIDKTSLSPWHFNHTVPSVIH